MTTLQGLFSCSISTSFQTDKLTVHMNDNTTRAIFNTIATYQTDCIHEYTRWQHYQGVFSHSIHPLYKGSIEQRNTECPLYVSWNMTGFLHHIRGHVLTLHHVIHTSLPMLYCRLTTRAWERRGVFLSPAHHATLLVCCVPERDTISLPRQWTGTTGIHHPIHIIVNQLWHPLCHQQEHDRGLQDYTCIHTFALS